MDKVDAKLAQAVVLLNRQFLLTEHLVKTRSEVLAEFERALTQSRQNLDHVLDVYNYTFALIDHLVRFQKIAFVLPRLNQKDREFRALDEAMGSLKEIRNQLQHLNNDIENQYTGPLLGAVCWVAGQKQFIASFNDVGRDRSSPGLVLDTHTLKYVQQFCYVYNGVYHDLAKAILGVHAFNAFVNAKVRVEVGGKLYDPKEHFLALSIEFRIPEKGQQP